MRGEIIIFGGLIVFICIMVYFMFAVYAPLTNALLTTIEIEVNMIPVEPYDVADIEKVTSMNDTHWELVVNLLDVETNSTIYDYCTYHIESKTFSGSKWIEQC